MTWSEQLAAELKREAAATGRVIERVPQETRLWKPHGGASPVRARRDVRT